MVLRNNISLTVHTSEVETHLRLNAAIACRRIAAATPTAETAEATTERLDGLSEAIRTEIADRVRKVCVIKEVLKVDGERQRITFFRAT